MAGAGVLDAAVIVVARPLESVRKGCLGPGALDVVGGGSGTLWTRFQACRVRV